MSDPDVIPLSLARSYGEFVFLSGIVGRESDRSIPSEFERQARLALEEVARLLESEGASMSTVLKTTVFLPARGDFRAMNALYAEYFNEPWPARSTLITDLALPELRFEIEVVAYRIA